MANTVETARRRFLRRSSIVLLSGSPWLGIRAAADGKTTAASVRDFGAIGDGQADDKAAIAAALRAVPAGRVTVPAGEYVVSNPLVVRGFAGELAFEPGARFIHTDPAKPGVTFLGGAGARIVNYHAIWREIPTVRLQVASGLAFEQTTDTAVNGCLVEHSNGAGLIFVNCVRPLANEVRIRHSLADGVHFANCLDGRAFNIVTEDTGDDGLAFVNYAAHPGHRGGLARNIVVRRSLARGIAVVGQSDVRIERFLVEDTSSSGILCAFEERWRTRVPENVLFQQGRIVRAGTFAPVRGNQFGVEAYRVRSATFEDVEVIDSGNRGLSVFSPDGEVAVARLKVTRARADSGADLRARRIEVRDLRVNGAPRYGVLFLNCREIVARDVQVTDVGWGFPLARAVWVEASEDADVEGVQVSSSREDAKRMVVGAHKLSRGHIRGVRASDATRTTVQLQNTSSGAVVSH